MASIKGVSRSASVALAPDGGYMAAGTMAGAVDLSFSSSANLEIFNLDFQSDDSDLKVVAEVQSSERFNRLTWGKNGSGSDEFSLGLIAGGLVDGNIDLWNPVSLLSSGSGGDKVTAHLTRHKGPVRGLEFNTFTSNLLASGADDGEICIWDLTKPAEPTKYPPLKGSGSAAQGEISYLSWNNKVPHILASTSYNGTTAVWDLKKQKPVISFSDSVRRRCSVLQWNPDLATQLAVASDEDGSPSLKLWDMRNTMSPVKEFVGHTKGVIAMAWCPTDSSYLVTCAKDNRTICWDTVTGEIVSELPASSNWNFDVHWYPKIPGIISASSFDGKIGIYNIEGFRHAAGESDFGTAPLRAPKWLKRPVGASFGFGGKLISFHPQASPGPGLSEVLVKSVVTEQTLINRSTEFETAIHNGERASLRDLCERKSQECESVDDRETWGFLKVLLEDDGTARSKLLTHLGFNLPTETKDSLQEQQLTQQVDTLGLEDSATEKAVNEAENISATFPIDNGEDFFNNLPSPKADTPVSNTGESFGAGDTVIEPPQDQTDGLVEESSDDPSFDDAVQRALVVGDYNEAVSLCISANKIADALVIANVGGESLWKSTRDKYLKMSQSPYLKVVSAMVNNDLESVVKNRPLKSWKETLALLCSFASEGEWITLCNLLASKLLNAGNTLAATLSFICAGNIDKTVEIWSRNLAVEHEGQSSVDLLQDLMEKTIVLALASGERRFSASVCKLVERYAEILASQGLLRTAMDYLKLLGTEELSPELVILKDRISYSTEAEKETLESSPSTVSWQPQQNSLSAYDNNYQQSYSSQQYMATDSVSNQYAAPDQYAAPAPYQPPAASSQYTATGSVSNQYQAAGPYQQPPSPQNPVYHQPSVPQPNMFVPSAPAQVLQPNFAARPAPAAQSTVRPFVPVAGPVLRNAEQYQQPSVPKPTLSSQLYPGSNPSYQPMVPPVGPVGPSPIPAFPSDNMPRVVNPDSAQLGFAPASLSGSAQRPAPPSAVAAPPPTVQTVDTKNVPENQKPVIATLSRLFYETSEALGGARANPVKKREIEDNSKKIGALFAKLNSGDISKNAADKLVHLCQALDKGDYATALQIQVLLTTSEWDECNFWLATLKRMIKTRQNVRL